MATLTTNISLTKPELSDTTKIREDINSNSDIIDGRFSSIYMAVQAKNAVTITGGSITGITDLAIADGGTGASTATAAFNALAPTTTQGDIIYSDGTNNVRLAKGTEDYVLTMGATIPEWAAAAAVGANTALSNLASVAINAALVLGTSNAYALGSTTKMWADLFLASGAVINFNNGNYTLTHSAGILTLSGTLALGANNLTMTGSLGVTGSRLTKIWTAALESTADITINGTALASIYSPIAGSASITTIGTVTSGTLSTGAVLADVTMTLGSDADGDVYYRASNKLTRLAKGTAAQVLAMNGGATAPEWVAAGAGSVTTSGTPVDNDYAKFTAAAVIEGRSYAEVKTDLNLIKCNNAGTTAPTANEDSDDGYAVNSIWGDTTNDKSYICLDATVASAVWKEISGATLALDNLSSVAINTSLISDTQDTDSLGSTSKEWLNLYIGDAGKIYIGLVQDLNIYRSSANVMTLTASSGVVTSAGLTVGGTLALGANSITMSGSIGVTGTRVTKGWFTDLQVTNAIAGSITGTAAIATGFTCTDNESEDLACPIVFVDGATGAQGAETDSDLHYNPSTGTVTATIYAGDGSLLTGVGEAAASALTISAKAAEDIDKGEVVYISGATGQTPDVSLADNTVAGKACPIGVAAETKTTGQTILIRVAGQLTGVNTSAFSDGDCLFLSTAGGLVAIAPTSGVILHVANVEYDAVAGKLLISISRKPQKGATSGTDLYTRLGDSIGVNKIEYRDYANNVVGYIDSDGKADFTSLTLDNPLLPTQGGTGVAQASASSTLTISGAYAITITVTEATGVTLPASGTLATLAGTEELTNKTLTSPNVNEAVALTSTSTKLNYITSATGTTGTTSTNIVFSTSPTLVTPVLGLATGSVIDLAYTNTVAGGDHGFQSHIKQETNALTGELHGAYITASNNQSGACSGTIRGLEVKARTKYPAGTGGTVVVLEGVSISADSKDQSVTTMRGIEVMLDGSTGGTVTEGVGIRIANNMQADKTTTMTALQIYSDSFAYDYGIDMSQGAGGMTIDIKLSKGETIANNVDGIIDIEGELDMNAHTIGFTQQTVSYNSGTTTVDWKLGNKAIMTFGAGNITTFAFTNPTNPCNLLLKIVQDGTGSRTVTNWDADIKWVGGTKPTLTTTVNGIDVISGYWDGINYFCVASLAFAVPA